MTQKEIYLLMWEGGHEKVITFPTLGRGGKNETFEQEMKENMKNQTLDGKADGNKERGRFRRERKKVQRNELRSEFYFITFYNGISV